MSIGAEVDPEKFAAWYHERPGVWDVVCTLDVGGVEGTRHHTHLLESMGVPVIPVFHVNEPDEALDYYLDKYPMVGFGGMVPYASRHVPLRRWLTRNLAKAQAAGVAVHALGQTNFRTLAGLPFWSSDSSTWSIGGRYGHALLWDPRRERQVNFSLGKRANPKIVGQHGDLLRRYGLDPAAVCTPGFAIARVEGKPLEVYRDEVWSIRAAMIRSQLEMARWWRSRFTVEHPQGLPAGPHVFLVMRHDIDLEMIRSALFGDGHRPAGVTS